MNINIFDVVCTGWCYMLTLSRSARCDHQDDQGRGESLTEYLLQKFSRQWQTTTLAPPPSSLVVHSSLLPPTTTSGPHSFVSTITLSNLPRVDTQLLPSHSV